MTDESPFHDRRGIPVCGGDLIRSDHFRDRRGRKHYLYHVAVLEGGHWWMVPSSWLNTREVRQGGKCRIGDSTLASSDVIAGHGPGDLAYYERPRKKGATA